ncbi:MAG: sigma-54 interaction domain-containing protein [Negativicutes bacterium]
MTNYNENCLFIVSMRKRPAEFLAESLTDILGNAIHIITHSYLEQGPIELSISPQLVLASGEFSYQEALRTFPKEKVLLANRDIALPENFEKIFLLPKGTKVLVINETKESTLDTIRNLIEIGIDFLEFTPYWSNCDEIIDAGIDVAISPGLLSLCPVEVKNKIDIGLRHLSITVFIKILTQFGLDLQFSVKFSSYHKLLLVKAYRRLSEQFRSAQSLKLSMELILNNITDAIILVKDNEIVECNPAAEKLINLPKRKILSENILEIFGDHVGQLNNDGIVIQRSNKKIFVNYIPLSSSSGETGIFTFKEIKEIEKLEENVRKILYRKDSGYIAKYSFDMIIAESPNIKELIDLGYSMSQHDSVVLITGESGTGKELFAQSIHNASPRRQHPFVAVNFSAIPDNLIESELFGYAEGAFTGAKKSGKKGLFELAHNGTIFLDEIGNSSVWIQSRLLRVIEEQEIMRLGDTKVIPINVRVIAATNKTLKELIEKQLFREDLYYRLNVFPIKIPPLRERPECVIALVKHFASKYKVKSIISPPVMEYITKYSWPGNVRELKNMITYLMLKDHLGSIEISDLPPDIRFAQKRTTHLETDLEATITFLTNQYDVHVIKAMLNIFKLNKSANIKIGRNKLTLELKKMGFNVSDSKVRTIIGTLESFNLVTTGKTKQGTNLSTHGDYLLYLLSGEL